jgi:putative FmdB family regulatory protein
MPIYAYKCESCGHAKDVLQKMSDAPLTVCPACGASTFAKQVTAAGFQLKGSGWYVTDFRGGNSGTPAASPATDGAASGSGEAAKSTGDGAGKSDAPAKPAGTASEGAAKATSSDSAKPATSGS